MDACEVNRRLKALYERSERAFLQVYREAFQDEEEGVRVLEYGIVDPERFDEDRRILVVAKEPGTWNEKQRENISNDYKEWLAEASRAERPKEVERFPKTPTMWYNLGRWIRLIRHPETDLEALAREKGSVLRELGYVAFTNINKVRGRRTPEGKIASGSAFRAVAGSPIAQQVLLEELRLIRPRIVILCGTAGVVDQDFWKEVKAARIKVIAMCHPAAPVKKVTLLRQVREKL